MLLLVALGLSNPAEIGFLLMSHAATPNGFLAGCFINQLGAGMLLPTLLVWTMSLLPFGIRSRGAGMWTGAFTFGQFLSPLAVTFAGKQVGGLLPAFGVLSIAALAAAIIALAANFRPAAKPAHG